MINEKLAIFGGPRCVPEDVPEQELFGWPYINKEIEDAVLDVIRRNAMSSTEITVEFEKEFAAWQQRKYGIAYCNGTLSLQAAMFGIGLGAGDEIIIPTKTYWASAISAMTLGASIVFANVDPNNLCLDPNDLERCLSPRTKAIMVVHYGGHPAEMDKICDFAKKHNIKVIEDVSHAQGGKFKGKMLGTFGDVAAMSLMSWKSFSCGELGILVTDDRTIYERSLAYSHYERNKPEFITETEELKPFYHLPLGGMKGRVNQVATAIGRVRLKDYDEKIAEIRKAMNYFCDLMEGVKGFRNIRVDEKDGSDMAGWYSPNILYIPEELGGLSEEKFLEALKAETGYSGYSGANNCLHTHNMLQDYDGLHTGKPSRILFADRDVREFDKALEPSEKIRTLSIPWFKVYKPEYIEMYANGYKKVVAHYRELLDENQDSDVGGIWHH